MSSKESGRTLMEMIGVLTIMGLLTVGAFALYGRASTKVHLNDLLDAVRKRALVSDSGSSRFTYGMFDKKEGGASAVTAYGYGVADNKTGVVRDFVKGYSVAKVPVGKINGGKPLTRGVCEALLKSVYDPDTASAEAETGAVIQLYEDVKCKKILKSCGSDDAEKTVPVPAIICIAIKS